MDSTDCHPEKPTRSSKREKQRIPELKSLLLTLKECLRQRIVVSWELEKGPLSVSLLIHLHPGPGGLGEGGSVEGKPNDDINNVTYPESQMRNEPLVSTVRVGDNDPYSSRKNHEDVEATGSLPNTTPTRSVDSVVGKDISATIDPHSEWIRVSKTPVKNPVILSEYAIEEIDDYFDGSPAEQKQRDSSFIDTKREASTQGKAKSPARDTAGDSFSVTHLDVTLLDVVELKTPCSTVDTPVSGGKQTPSRSIDKANESQIDHSIALAQADIDLSVETSPRCSQCLKTFSTFELLNRHLCISPFFCESCDKYFYQLISLQSHVRIFHVKQQQPSFCSHQTKSKLSQSEVALKSKRVTSRGAKPVLHSNGKRVVKSKHFEIGGERERTAIPAIESGIDDVKNRDDDPRGVPASPPARRPFTAIRKNKITKSVSMPVSSASEDPVCDCGPISSSKKKKRRVIESCDSDESCLNRMVQQECNPLTCPGEYEEALIWGFLVSLYLFGPDGQCDWAFC